MFSATGRRRSIVPRATGPTAILRMYMSGSVCREPGSPTAITSRRCRRARRSRCPRAGRPRDRPSRRRFQSGCRPAASRSPDADDDASVDRQELEPRAHAGRRRLRGNLVGPSQPAGTRQRGAPSFARSSHRDSGVSSRSPTRPSRAWLRRRSRVHLPRAVGGREHELHHGGDRLLAVAVLDHRHASTWARSTMKSCR